MEIGETFVYEEEEFCVKRIILPGCSDNKGKTYPKGRVDASKFTDEGSFRKLQRGRPKMFDYPTVANLLGDFVEPNQVESDLSDEDEEKLESWRGERADPEKIRAFIEKYHTNEEVEASDTW